MPEHNILLYTKFYFGYICYRSKNVNIMTRDYWPHAYQYGGNLHGWTCHTPRQHLQSCPSGHLGGWATPWSAEEMLDGQRQEWTSLLMPELLTMASCRKDWKRISAESFLMPPPPPRRPNRPWDWIGLTAWYHIVQINNSQSQSVVVL